MRTILSSLFLSLLLTSLATAQTSSMQASHRFGEYVVHPGTMITANLDPKVAAKYDIQRSDHRGLVTVAVRRQTNGGSQPVKAEVSATLVNLSAQRRDLSLREVDEGQAIYYLADFRIDPPETIKVQFRIQPQGSDRTLKFELSRTFGAE